MRKNASAAGSNNGRRMNWWKKILQSVGAATGLFAAGCSMATPAAAQDSAYRPAASAPAAWLAFAKHLQARFEQRLAGDDPQSHRFQETMAKRGADGDTPLALIVRTWVRPDGAIDRIEFDGLDDRDIAARIRAILVDSDVGAPPADMLQPLRLRLSLRPKDQAGRGE
jgi:hypothetical protein